MVRYAAATSTLGRKVVKTPAFRVRAVRSVIPSRRCIRTPTRAITWAVMRHHVRAHQKMVSLHTSHTQKDIEQFYATFTSMQMFTLIWDRYDSWTHARLLARFQSPREPSRTTTTECMNEWVFIRITALTDIFARYLIFKCCVANAI